MKKCSRCKEIKDVSEFAFQNKKENKLVSACKECMNKSQREKRKENPEKFRRKDKESYYKNKERKIKYAREYRKNNKEKTRNVNLKSKYNISQEDYERMKIKQNFRCAICNEHEDNLKRILCVDHNHQTGKVRGLLCDTCNKFLGFYEKLNKECEEYLINTSIK